MASTQTVSEAHTERTRRTKPTSKRRSRYDDRMRFSSPHRAVSRGTQTLEISDHQAALNKVYGTLSPAPQIGRKSRSVSNQRVENFHQSKQRSKTSTSVTTTTEIDERDASMSTRGTAPNLPMITTRRTPAVLAVGNVVEINQPDGTERLAMICELSTYHESRIVVVCAWLYTRAEIYEDLMDKVDFSSEESHEYLQSTWPILNNDGTLMMSTNRSQCDYMVSTKRTIIVSDMSGTWLNVIPPHVATKVCHDAIYHADSAKRRISDVSEGSCYWLEKILSSRSCSV